MGKGSTWQEGPCFLSQPTEEWPVMFETKNVNELPELKKSILHIRAAVDETLASSINISRFSNLNRLLHTTARITYAYK